MRDADFVVSHQCDLINYHVGQWGSPPRLWPWVRPVPDSKSRNIPEVVIVRRGQLGFWEFGEGETVG